MFDFIKKTFKVWDYVQLILTSLILLLNDYVIIKQIIIGDWASVLCTFLLSLVLIMAFLYCCYLKKDEYTLIKRVEEGIDVINLTQEEIVLYLSGKSKFLREEDIKILIDNLINFWHNIFEGSQEQELRDALKGTKIFFQDVKYIEKDDRKFAGYALPKAKIIYITTLTNEETLLASKEKIESLLQHEISHVLLCNYKSEYCSEITSHDFFKKVGTNF